LRSEQIAVSFVDRAEFETFLRASAAESLDALRVEHELDA